MGVFRVFFFDCEKLITMASTRLSSPLLCNQCSRFIRTSADQDLACRRCRGGFVEQVHNSPSPTDSSQDSSAGLIRVRRYRTINAGGRSSYNPVVVFRRPDTNSESDITNYQLYFDDNSGIGLQQMPSDSADMLMSSGLDRLLEHLTHLENNGVWRSHKPPASKAIVDSLPTIVIGDCHMAAESHCAICTEQFEINAEAREMPCKHIYHSSCVLPWLALRNSCPVCRHGLPTDSYRGKRNDEDVGLTIWRLPGGGYAVGRFTGGRRAGEAELPLVYTEMDGGLNIASSSSDSGVSRGIQGASRGSRSTEHVRSFSSTIRHFFSLFGRRRRNSNEVSTPGESMLMGRR